MPPPAWGVPNKLVISQHCGVIKQMERFMGAHRISTGSSVRNRMGTESFYLVYYHLKITIWFWHPWNEPFISAEGKFPLPPETTIFHHHAHVKTSTGSRVTWLGFGKHLFWSPRSRMEVVGPRLKKTLILVATKEAGNARSCS